MGKGKGGGGGGSTPQIQIPSGLSELPGNAFNPIGTFGTEQFGGLNSLANWAANLATGGNALGTNGTLPANGLLSDSGAKIYSPFTSTSGSGGTGSNSLLGPFLTQQQQGIQGMEAGTITGEKLLKQSNQQANTLLNEGQSLLGEGGNTQMQGWGLQDQGISELNQATTGSGLFSSQQAYIDQAVKSQQSAIQQQLSNEGLGSSTVNAQLQGQAKMSGAAAAGQLIQGNIQAAQQTIGLGQNLMSIGDQQIGLGQAQIGLGQESQKISLSAQEALSTQFQSIAQLSGSEQAQLWGEAQQGYGTLGQMMNTTLGAFGYSLQEGEAVLQANEQEAQIQAGIQTQQAQMAQQGASSMFGALGSLLGSGSGGGGLLGGLGGLLGGAGGAGAGAFGTVGGLASGAASAGAAGSLGALGGSAGGIISSVGSALGALFCEVARTVYGVDSPDWLLFRDWILFKAPKPVRTAYVIHAFQVSRWIKGRPIICRIIKWAMNAVLWYDNEITG